jgi:pyruvate/2-oxoglutarate dehydrogenase complex dihydrolipoamide dehydrogenase (E3) component
VSDERFDLVVIGGGSAGLTAADFAVKLGAKTALIEKHRIGGDCTWSGCVPSKALLHAAKVVHQAREASAFGVRAHEQRADWSRVRDYVQRSIATVYAHEDPAQQRAKGVEVIEGAARFESPSVIVAGERRLSAARAIVCTGARPFVPPIKGLAEAGVVTGVVTYEQIFSLDALPERLVIVGGGPIGLEMAQAFQRLGSNVCVVSDELLPREEPSARAVIRAALEREGVTFLQGSVESVSRSSDGLHIETRDDTLEGDLLLVATGRRANTEGLALDLAGVRVERGAIVVDGALQTTAKGVYAAGDVLGGPQFTHWAGWQGFRAARNALLPGSDPATNDVLPRITFLDPEVASVGLTEEQARAKHGAALRVHRTELSACDRAVCDGRVEGFVQVLALADQRVVGATIVAPRAGEMLSEIAVAMQHGLTLGQLAEVIHGYPSWSTAVHQTVVRASVDAFLAGSTAKVAIQLGRWLR